MNQRLNTVMLCKKYYETYGKESLSAIPGIQGHYAAGLVGEGSECFGFEDIVSTDHDFFPRFYIWLDDDCEEKYFDEVQHLYQTLPDDFQGLNRKDTIVTPAAVGREGAMKVSDFYQTLLGRGDAPSNLYDWIGLQETRLATVTNGMVFEDTSGKFTAIRDALKEGFPQDVRYKKMALRLRKMAQSGQYQYGRCMQHGETVAAYQAMNEFIQNTLSFLYLYNNAYMPYFKWSHRGLRNLPIFAEIGSDLTDLAGTSNQMGKWDLSNLQQYKYKVNTQDLKVLIIENICHKIAKQLRKDQLSASSDNYLEAHANEVEMHIQDIVLQQANIIS